MSTSLASSGVSLTLAWNQSATNTGAPPTTNQGQWVFGPTFSASGSGAGQANEFIDLIRTLAGFTVDSTHKSLKVLNGDSGVSAKYVISIIGTNT